MQNAYAYFRPGTCPANSVYTHSPSGISRTRDGLDTFTVQFIARCSLPRLLQLMPDGAAYPDATNFPGMYLSGIGNTAQIPAYNETVWRGVATYEGIFELNKRSAVEEWGYWVKETFIPRSATTTAGVNPRPTGMPADVYDLGLVEGFPSYRRMYFANAVPAYPAVASSPDGQGMIPAAYQTPAIPASFWGSITHSLAAYNFPWGWYLVSRTCPVVRLSTGAAIPIYQITETWMYRPALTPGFQ